MRKAIVLLLLAAMILSCVACGKAKSGKPAPQESSEAKADVEETEENSSEPAQEAQDSSETVVPDYGNPAIVIEAGDVDAIKDFATKMQSFEIPEGTAVKITGVWNKPGMSPSIVEYVENSSENWGVQMFFDYEQEDLTDGTQIEAVGYVVFGEYYAEFHIEEGNLRILESAD